MRTDLRNSIDIAQHIDPASYDATETPANGVDLANFETAVVVFNVGAVANDDFTFEIQSSSDDGDTDAFSAVAAADLDGSVPDAPAANTATTVGYYGSDRYVRVVATDGGTGDAIFGVSVIRGGARVHPTA